MPTRTTVTTFKIRLRPELKQKLERVAKKRDRSINLEMVERLEQSFGPVELVSLGKVAGDIERAWEKFAAETFRQGLQENLMRSAENLIEQLPKELRNGQLKAAVERMQQSIATIAGYVGRDQYKEKETNK
jgi:predicted transcriptional regulator